MNQIHFIEPERKTLHGSFSKDFEPVLSVESGDTVRFRTLDVSWGLEPFSQDGSRKEFPDRDPVKDKGHALCGPVAVKGAKPGMTLEIHINRIVPGAYGFTAAGGFPSEVNQKMGLDKGERYRLDWKIDADLMTAESQFGHRVKISPFMGIIGMPPEEEGIHSTTPPRNTGGNIDCKDLTAGSTLYLPIEVEGGLLSVGDGHAVQGDGEVANPALECPMECIDLTLFLREDLKLSSPRAKTADSWITFGFDEDLDQAALKALEEMVKLMGEQYGVEPKEAVALASTIVNLRISQIVNGVKGVHAVLPHGALSGPLSFGKHINGGL
jgi:acetamidase/formamidase